MSEHTPPASEEPPSLSPREPYVRTKKPVDILEGLAVTDDKDPFRWLFQQTVYNLSRSPISVNGKHMLWFVYRLNGNFPISVDRAKWRDKELQAADFAHLTEMDQKYIDAYQAHLDAISMEEALSNTEAIERAQAALAQKALEAARLAREEREWADIRDHLDFVAGRTALNTATTLDLTH